MNTIRVEAEILHCQRILADIHRMVEGLELDGTPPSAPIFTVLAERGQKAVDRWEVVAFLNWEQKFYIQKGQVCEN